MDKEEAARLGAWLRELGLERYEDAFVAHEIDWRVLGHLTSEDLKEMGILPVGHRRLLLQAIAALNAHAAPAEAEPSENGSSADAAAWAGSGAAPPRRHLFKDALAAFWHPGPRRAGAPRLRQPGAGSSAICGPRPTTTGSPGNGAGAMLPEGGHGAADVQGGDHVLVQLLETARDTKDPEFRRIVLNKALALARQLPAGAAAQSAPSEPTLAPAAERSDAAPAGGLFARPRAGEAPATPAVPDPTELPEVADAGGHPLDEHETASAMPEAAAAEPETVADPATARMSGVPNDLRPAKDAAKPSLGLSGNKAAVDTPATVSPAKEMDRPELVQGGASAVPEVPLPAAETALDARPPAGAERPAGDPEAPPQAAAPIAPEMFQRTKMSLRNRESAEEHHFRLDRPKPLDPASASDVSRAS